MLVSALLAVSLLLEPTLAGPSLPQLPMGSPLASCANVKPIFVLKNVSKQIPDVPVASGPGSVCPAERSCCTAEMEDKLRTLVRHDLQSVIRHSVLSVQGVLQTSTATYSERLMELVQHSENHTAKLIAELYTRLAPQAREPVAVLHAELRRALAEPPPSAYFNNNSSELEDAVYTFFSQLFPLVYRHSILNAQGDLSPDYAVCLQATMPEVQPFGETPRALATALGKSVRAARVLLIALRLGIEALDNTERVWERGDECSTALLRMSYCAKCTGYATVKPCAGYCLNVLRGCLLHLAELDSSWNGFVDGMERLILANRSPSTMLNSEAIIHSIGARVSEAIMFAMENGPALEKRVKIACGPALWTHAESSNASKPEKAVWKSPAMLTVQPEGQSQFISLLNGVLASLERSRRFYAGLADFLCSDESFAETADDVDCWNGLRVAQYTRAVVGPGLNAQKYNPEMSLRDSRQQPDSRVAQLSDRLRHTRQLLLSQLSSTLEADSLVLDQGSGSGAAREWNTDDEDGPSWEGSGSGSGPKITNPGDRGSGKSDGSSGRSKTSSPTPVSGKISSAHALIPNQVWTVAIIILFVYAQQ